MLRRLHDTSGKVVELSSTIAANSHLGRDTSVDCDKQELVANLVTAVIENVEHTINGGSFKFVARSGDNLLAIEILRAISNNGEFDLPTVTTWDLAISYSLF